MAELHISCVADLISAIGGNAAFARMIGVGPSTASEMKRRGRVPAEYWRDLVRGAQALGHHQVTAELLMILHARSAAPQGFAEEDAAPFALSSDMTSEPKSDGAPSGHFSRFKHLRRPHFRTAEEIEDHIRALRDEWSHR